MKLTYGQFENTSKIEKDSTSSEKVDSLKTENKLDTTIVSEFSRLINISRNQKKIISLQDMIYDNCLNINKALTVRLVEKDEKLLSLQDRINYYLVENGNLERKIVSLKTRHRKVLKIGGSILLGSLVTNYFFIKKL